MGFKDKEKQRRYQKEWYQKNKDKIREHRVTYAREDKNRKNQIVRRYCRMKGCFLCGYNRCSRSLHFHHLDPKTKKRDVSGLLAQNYSLRIIKEEMAKCILVCANCHGEIHAGIIKIN